ncbi:uncharacterized protein TNCV_492051 [Trichonephila clavipes]|nr:uncharacterized protein TNCV_492051 [Trichonephila clavipes]
MGTTNHHRPWGLKSRLVRVICKNGYNECNVEWNEKGLPNYLLNANSLLDIPFLLSDSENYFTDLIHLKFETECHLHWCAKIKDEVEKLAYQLNDEAERTERPIRRLSKGMYGSTCADMQVDVMGKCLSSIKHVVGTTSGCFTRGRIIGKLDEGRSVTSVAAEFGIAHSIVSRLWRQFQTLQEQLSGGSVVVVHEEPHPQMTGK